MSFSLYRKYRPKSFNDLIGQDYLVDIFKNAAKKELIGHAYLLYGPRGTGKTTTARLVAKLVNCESLESLKKSGEPCNKCSVCQQIDGGRALDIVEMDAASNRGIDEIRNLKDNIRLLPSSFRKKVYIIDEAHMLTKEAFNALLKTLEEPPEHIVIILATTEYDKVPSTITSRCQRFHFHKLPVGLIVKKLKIITEKEKFKIDEDVLELIAVAAEGGLRDAESLLDQVSASASHVDLKTAESIIGKVGARRVTELIELVSKDDLGGVLRYLHELNNSGANLVDLNKELIHYLRRVLAFQCEPKLELVFQNELTKDELIKIKVHSQRIPARTLIPLLKSLIRSYGEVRYSPFPHVPLEVALIENLKK